MYVSWHIHLLLVTETFTAHASSHLTSVSELNAKITVAVPILVVFLCTSNFQVLVTHLSFFTMILNLITAPEQDLI